jgi:hypothetical protein
MLTAGDVASDCECSLPPNSGPSCRNSRPHNPFASLTICDWQAGVDVVRAGALQFADPLANQECGRNSDRKMDVRFSGADLVEDETFD